MSTLDSDLMIAPYIVAVRWEISKKVLSCKLGSDDVVDYVLEWLFCDVVGGVWCTQNADRLDDTNQDSEEEELGWRHKSHLSGSLLYGISCGSYVEYIRNSLLQSESVEEIMSYAWMACAEYGHERVCRETALDHECRVNGFRILEGVTRTVNDCMSIAGLVREGRRKRIERSNRYSCVIKCPSSSAAGRWFASNERSWSDKWNVCIGRLVYDMYTTDTGELGYHMKTDRSLSGWTHW